MPENYFRKAFRVFTFSAFTSLIVNTLIYFLLNSLFTPLLIAIPFFPFVIKLLYLRNVDRLAKQEPSKYFVNYLKISSIRFILNLLAAILLLFLDFADKRVVVLVYLVSYFVLVSVEVSDVTKALKRKS